MTESQQPAQPDPFLPQREHTIVDPAPVSRARHGADNAVDAIVVVAMDEEAAPFLAAATITRDPVQVGGAVLTRLALGDRRVLLVRSGISYVNAASGLVAALADSLQGSAAPGSTRPSPIVISAGTAGGLGAGIQVGHVIVGTEYIHAQVDATAFGYALGQVPRMPATYVGSAALTGAARQVASDAPLHRGLILAGDSFASPEFAQRILDEWPGALCYDMESAALAQVAFNYGLPFVSVRGISDLCGPDEFNTHVDDAASRSAAVVLDLIARA